MFDFNSIPYNPIDMHKLEIESKIVFPIVSEERAVNYKWFDGGENIDNKVCPITKSQLESIAKRHQLSVPAIVDEGTVLMRHPYLPNKLVSANLTMAEFVNEKLGYYAEILNCLGATKQKLEARIISKQTRKLDSKGKIVIKGNKFEGKFFSVKKLFSKVKCTRNIEGTGDLDHEKALKKATEYGLVNDYFVREILALRDENPIKRYEFKCEIANEFNENIDVAASLCAAAGAFKIKGSLIKEIETREEIYIVQDILFI